MEKLIVSEHLPRPHSPTPLVVGRRRRIALALLLMCSSCGSDGSDSDGGAGGEPGSIGLGGATSSSGGQPVSTGGSASSGSTASGGSGLAGGSGAGGSTTGTAYLPCDSQADCAAYGGGKVCCEATTAAQVMRFCTKQSACSGQVLP
ncbi:MAG TPA: hypothetical protein VER33_19370 [Polyangiaceae bacterium]|nr:hypothetical protein [Polyangiaceae bacterium]